MWLTLTAVAIGAIAGVVSGGSISAIGRARPLAGVFALAWVILAGLTRWFEVPGARGLFLAANVAGLMFAAVNVKRLGSAILFFGLALNTAVIALNGSMPYRVTSVISAGLASTTSDFPQTIQTRPEQPGDLLLVLSDTIPINAWFIHDVLSLGDLLIALGAAWISYRTISNNDVRKPDPRSSTAQLASAAPGTTLLRQTDIRELTHRSTIRLGEAFDLVDDDEPALSTGTPAPSLSDDVAVSQQRPSSPDLEVVIDLTNERSAPVMSPADSGLSIEHLLLRLVNHHGDALDDDETGPLPGSLFWEERNKQRMRDARQAIGSSQSIGSSQTTSSPQTLDQRSPAT
jgi:hypothetical protein